MKSKLPIPLIDTPFRKLWTAIRVHPLHPFERSSSLLFQRE
jgi:hypothetical protein